MAGGDGSRLLGGTDCDRGRVAGGWDADGLPKRSSCTVDVSEEGWVRFREPGVLVAVVSWLE